MNSNTLAICPKCYQVPIFKFSPSEPGKIVIICHCGFNEGIWIKDYLKKIENTPTDKTRFKCEKHNARFGYFCVNCNLHYCQTCHDSAEYKVHNDEYHSVFILNKPKDEMISKFKEGSTLKICSTLFKEAIDLVIVMTKFANLINSTRM